MRRKWEDAAAAVSYVDDGSHSGFASRVAGGAAISPIFAGFMFSRAALIDIPFFIAGKLKIAYDLVLYREFRAIRPLEEAD